MRNSSFLMMMLLMGKVCLAVDLDTFTVKRNPATLGVDFKIGYPAGWPKRPSLPGTSLVSFWATPVGVADCMSLVVPSQQRLTASPPTKEELRRFFDDPRFEAGIVGGIPGARFIRKSFLADHKYPALFVDYTIKSKTPTGEVLVKVRNHIVYLHQVMLQVQFYLVQDEGPDRLEEFSSEMRQVMDTLEIIPAS